MKKLLVSLLTFLRCATPRPPGLLVTWGDDYHRPLRFQDVGGLQGLMRLSCGRYRYNLPELPAPGSLPWITMEPGHRGQAELRSGDGRAWIAIELRDPQGELADALFTLGMSPGGGQD